MGLVAVLLLAVALSLDTFAVAVSIGMCRSKLPTYYKFRYLTIIGLFHFIMPVIGWLLGVSVYTMVEHYDHWISFALLSFLGIKMIYGALGKKDDEPVDFCKYISLGNALLFGVALSIDAIIARFSFSMVKLQVCNISQFMNLLLASAIIGLVAFFATWFGITVGSYTGNKIGKHSEIVGGIVLISLGIKTLIDHLS